MNGFTAKYGRLGEVNPVVTPIRIGLLDEIFQAADPVLVGVDAQSTFCFLLSPEEHRDADTWGIRLLELVDRGFAPQATIADFASGSAPGTRRLCLRSPAAVMFFMRCTTSGRWSVTWRTGPTKPSTPGPSWSESKPLPSGGPEGPSGPEGPESGQEALVRTAG